MPFERYRGDGENTRVHRLSHPNVLVVQRQYARLDLYTSVHVVRSTSRQYLFFHHKVQVLL